MFLSKAMDEAKLTQTVEEAAAKRSCRVADITLDDDNNIEVIISREEPPVELADCEAVHRAVLAAFDRDIEDYALTVSSQGISGEEADRMLKETIE